MSEDNTQERKKIRWTTDKIVSTSALFISVISLIALLYQSYLAREENKLIQKQQSASVLPHLSQWFSNTPDGFKIVIGNKGVGPAFIKKVSMVYNDSITFDNSDRFIEHVFNSNKALDTVPVSTSTFTEGYVLPANQTIEIVWLKSRTGIRVFKEVLEKNSLVYSILYEDVYGTRWRLTNENDVNVPIPIPKED